MDLVECEMICRGAYHRTSDAEDTTKKEWSYDDAIDLR